MMFLLFIALISCHESTLTEPKSDFEEFTDKVWVYQSSNIGTFEYFSPQKMKFHKDSICEILIGNNWENGKWLTNNFKLGLLVIYDNDSLNQKNDRFNIMKFDFCSKDSLVIHFGSTKDGAYHTFVPEK